MQYKQRAGEEDDLDSIQAFTPILQSFSRDMSSESNPSLLLEAFPFVLEYDMCYKDDWVFLTLFNPQINQFGLHLLRKSWIRLSSNYETLMRLGTLSGAPTTQLQ